MERLIAAGATSSLKNRHGMTALMSAAYSGHADCVQVLLSAGAEVNARNNLEAIRTHGSRPTGTYRRAESHSWTGVPICMPGIATT